MPAAAAADAGGDGAAAAPNEPCIDREYEIFFTGKVWMDTKQDRLEPSGTLLSNRLNRLTGQPGNLFEEVNAMPRKDGTGPCNQGQRGGRGKGGSRRQDGGCRNDRNRQRGSGGNGGGAGRSPGRGQGGRRSE